MPEHYDYRRLKRDKLIRHCEAYADAIHAMASKIEELEREKKNYRERLEWLKRYRELFHQ
jgi:prefoldin subunit 5